MATPCPAGRTLKEAIHALQEACKNHKDPELSEDIRSIVVHLKSSLLRHRVSSHAFNESAGPRLLLQLLSQCACSVGDATLLLGVLANICALDKSCRETVVREQNVIIGFLKSDEASVLNTAARLVANLCLDDVYIPSLATSNVGQLLVGALSTQHPDTRRSVLRAIRLLASCEQARAEVRRDGGLESVIQCLQDGNEQVVMATVRTLHALIVDTAVELCTKNTLQVLVKFTAHTEEAVREAALKLCLLASKCSEGRVALSSSDGVEALVTIIQRPGQVNCEVINAICTCCRDVISRQRLRECGGLSTLINLLKDDSQADVHMAVISALVCYYFDQSTLNNMVLNMDLLPTLVHHLNKDSVEHVDDRASLEERATVETPPITPPPLKKSKMDSPDLLESILSPPSCLVELPRPQLLPPPTTPLQQVVCFQLPLFIQVVLLLSRISHLKDCLLALSQPPILSELLAAFLAPHTYTQHLYKILLRVFTNPHCFEHTLQCQAPSILLRNNQSEMCRTLLGRLIKVGNSPYGQGVLTHMLLRGEHQACSALAVPVLCKSLRVCKRLMLDHGGYQQLCSLLTSTDECTQTKALDSLSLLVSSLPHFVNHTPPPLTQPPPPQYCRYMDSDLCPFDLMLVVSTNRIPVHRHVMSRASDVFDVMLNGPYREGCINEVHLVHSHPSAFIGLVHHAYGCSWECPRVTRPHPLTTPTDPTEQLITSISQDTPAPTLAAHCLHVMVIASQYLVEELSTLCQHSAVQYVLPSNVVEMFYLSRMHQCHCLSESCLHAVMGTQDRNTLRDMVNSYVCDDVLNMLKMFVSLS